jgi:hypothetical protein
MTDILKTPAQKTITLKTDVAARANHKTYRDGSPKRSPLDHLAVCIKEFAQNPSATNRRYLESAMDAYQQAGVCVECGALVGTDGRCGLHI